MGLHSKPAAWTRSAARQDRAGQLGNVLLRWTFKWISATSATSVEFRRTSARAPAGV